MKRAISQRTMIGLLAWKVVGKPSIPEFCSVSIVATYGRLEILCFKRQLPTNLMTHKGEFMKRNYIVIYELGCFPNLFIASDEEGVSLIFSKKEAKKWAIKNCTWGYKIILWRYYGKNT